MSTKKQFQVAIEQLTLLKEEKEAIKTTPIDYLNTDLTEISINPDADLRQRPQV